MKIMLVNVDSRWNMAIRKMYAYYLKHGCEVEMLDLGFSAYPHRRTKVIDAAEFDKVCVSNIFELNKDSVTVTGCNDVTVGGIGSNNPHLQLPQEIEETEPFYFPDEDTTYTFITRGCIRNCWFCKVPKFEGNLKEYNRIENVVKHKKVKFLDNNILAYDKHMEVFQWCIEHPDIRVEFNQGLDFRLVNDENLAALAKLHYMGEYTFAFDDPKFQPLLDKKILQIKQHISKPWKVKFYIYFHPCMEVKQLIERAEWCRLHECLPYVMRDAACWEADTDLKNFLIDFAAYCNQPSMFKKKDFKGFLEIRYKNQERINKSFSVYQKAIE